MDMNDFPKRLNIDVSTITHAALYQDETGTAVTACGMVYPTKVPTFMLPGKRAKLPKVTDEGEITCKSCLRMLKIGKPETIEQECKRYVIMDRKSRLFYEYQPDEKTKVWTASVFNASWFFTEKIARMVLVKTWFERKKGKKRILRDVYNSMPDKEKKDYIYMHAFDDKKYEVKIMDMQVQITSFQEADV